MTPTKNSPWKHVLPWLLATGCGSPFTAVSTSSHDPVESPALEATGGLPSAPLDGGSPDKPLGTGGRLQSNPGATGGQGSAETGGTSGTGGLSGTGGSGSAGTPSTGGAAAGGSPGAGGAPADAGGCPTDQKLCGGSCAPKVPFYGCGRGTCETCPGPLNGNGIAACSPGSGMFCYVECFSGFQLSQNGLDYYCNP